MAGKQERQIYCNCQNPSYRKKMRKMSLRMRLMLTTGFIMAVICILNVSFMVWNAQMLIIRPIRNISEDEVIVEKTYEQWEQTEKTGITEEIPGNWEDAGKSETFEIEEDGDYAVIQFYLAAFVGMIVILLIGMVLIYCVSGISLKPVKDLQNSIVQIDESDLSKRVGDFSAVYELDALACSFNQMLDRIQKVFEQEKEFSASAAHELKTPLAVIRTNIDVLGLSESPESEEYEETFAIVRKQTERMAALVEDLLTIYMMDNYEIEEALHVDQLMKEIIDENRRIAEEKGIVITFQGVDSIIKANPAMLSHALSNLIQNAIKYNMENGVIDIRILRQNGICRITVSDTGIGISPEAAEHIFQPFYREDKSRARKNGGAGLGLSIVKKIVEQHSGTVRYCPNNPKGAVFIVEIPENRIS